MNRKLDTYRVMNLKLDTFELEIYQYSVRNRHYFHLTSGMLELKIGELGFKTKCKKYESDSFLG